MEERDLTVHGYPGYLIREDGWLINRKGRMIGGNTNGQVRLQLHEGQGSEWRSLAWLVAVAFIPQPAGHTYLGFKDGDSGNMHRDNLGWHMNPQGTGRKRAEVLRLLVEGNDAIEVKRQTGCSAQYIRKLASVRLEELKAIEDYPQN